MLQTHEDGGLRAALPLFEKLPYELSNRGCFAQADGSFGISQYALSGRFPVFEPNSFYAALSLDGRAVPFGAQKEISMFGREQAIFMELPELSVQSSVFLGDELPAVFQAYRLRNRASRPVCFRAAFGFLLALDGMPKAGGDADGIAVSSTENGLTHRLPNGFTLAVACGVPLCVRESEGRGLHYAFEVCLAPGECAEVKLAYALGGNEPRPAASLLRAFDGARAQAQEYAAFLRGQSVGGTEAEKAMFLSALNCALSSYKETDGFQGFYAGVHYQSPPRTYYRDGYFTVLAVLPYKPEWVRNELFTLALGIGGDGSCPSAVIDENRVFWPDHEDSPAFFVLMLHDYLAATKDFSVLAHTVRGKTVTELALLAADGLLKKADGAHLIYREAGNRHDWADNIFREGYVTYMEALFYRAVLCMGRILEALHDPRAGRYQKEAERIRAAINGLLWNEEKGFYNNYVSRAYTEDNLSIDTVLTVLFRVADEERSRTLLKNMERLLESKNNPLQPFGDWGTMCCFPLYQYPEHLVEKSAYPFVYHNGSDWPYWSCAYAFAKGMYGMDARYPLMRWFSYSLEQGWATPAEYFNPVTGRGSPLQAWGAMGAFALLFMNQKRFPYEL